MRNLKRALSLGLTTAMISGLMVMGSSAASYADVTSEDNQEAIEVLEAVGIMIGDENGNFNPDQNVTRNEMAVVMANLMEYNVATYKDTSPFTDVPSWAEPYVAACWTNGITAGYSDTIYGGSDTVTTAQAALMLMKALGYFQYASDFGSDWQLATTRQGNAIDLFVGVDSGVTAPMTRNDVAQLVLNTLESGMVNPTTNGSITVGGVTIATDVKYNYITSNEGFAESISDATSTDANSDAKKSIVELGEHLYEGDLAKDGGHDAFGRPAAIWSYKDNEIGTYVDDRTETWTTKVTERDLYRAAGTAAVNDYAWTIWVDGDDVDTTAHGEGYELDRNDTERWMKTGNGVLTEMFVDTVNETVDVTIINTYVGQVTRVEPNEDNTDYAVTVSFETQPDGYVSRQFNTEDEFAMDDIVVMGIANGTIETMAVAETVEGSITAVKDFDSVEIGDTKYDYNYGYTATTPRDLIHVGLVDLDGNGIQNPDTGDDITLYLDTNGCVVAMADASSVAEDYLYVKGTHEEFGNVYAEVVYYDGSEEVIKIDEVDGQANNGEANSTQNIFYDYDGSDGTTANNPSQDHKVYRGVYQYSRSGNAYDLFSSRYNNPATNKNFEVTALFTDSDDNGMVDNGGNKGRIEKGHAVFGPYNGSSFVSDASGNKTSTANDNTVYVDTVRNITYTGYRNVPTMTDVEGFVVVEGRGGIADIVFITNDVDYELDNDSFFYISDLNPRKTTDADGNTIWIYNVNREGEPDQELTASADLASQFASGKGFYKIEKYDSHDYVTTVSPVVLENDSNPAVADLLNKGTIAYAVEAEGNTLILSDNGSSKYSGDRTRDPSDPDYQTDGTFSLNDETVYLTAYLSKDNTKVDRVALGSFNQIRSAKEYNSDLTGVYVLNSADKTNAAPTAKLVLIVSYTEYVDTTPYAVNFTAEADLPTGITSLKVTDANGNPVTSGDKIVAGTSLTVTATTSAGYAADIKVNGVSKGAGPATFQVTGATNITVEAENTNVMDESEYYLDYATPSLDSGNAADVTFYHYAATADLGKVITTIQEDLAPDYDSVEYSMTSGKVTFTCKLGGLTYYYELDTTGSNYGQGADGMINGEDVTLKVGTALNTLAGASANGEWYTGAATGLDSAGTETGYVASAATISADGGFDVDVTKAYVKVAPGTTSTLDTNFELSYQIGGTGDYGELPTFVEGNQAINIKITVKNQFDVATGYASSAATLISSSGNIVVGQDTNSAVASGNNTTTVTFKTTSTNLEVGDYFTIEVTGATTDITLPNITWTDAR